MKPLKKESRFLKIMKTVIGIFLFLIGGFGVQVVVCWLCRLGFLTYSQYDLYPVCGDFSLTVCSWIGI